MLAPAMVAPLPTPAPDLELRGLKLSVAGAMGMAALGIGFFFLTNSEAVLLDGIFSLVGFAVALITTRVAALVRKPDDEHFHFGYAIYEPMLNLTKGLLIAVISVFAAASAIDTLFEGGREIEGGLIIAYALTACAGCLAIAGCERRIARHTGSPLAKVDSANWLIDGLISGTVALAFVIVVFIEKGSLSHLAPYADPAVVLLLVLLSLPVPIAIIRSNWGQVLGRAPDSALQAEVHREISGALEGVEGIEARLRMLETGRSFYLQAYLILGEKATVGTVEECDELRDRIYQAVWDGTPDVGVDVIFTRDPRWSQLSIGTKAVETS